MRSVLVIVVMSVVAALALALVSRAPAELRNAEPDPGATDPALEDRFSDEQVERHDAYRRAGYATFIIATILEIAVLVVLARGPVARFVDRLSLPGGWPVIVLVVALGVAFVMTLAATPLAFVRGYVIEQAWGLSTQDIGGWVSDRGRGLLVGGVVAAVSALAFYGLVRLAGRFWWIWAWIVFTLLSLVFAYIWPVVVAPLFNRFEPVEDAAVVARVEQLADKAGLEVDKVLVSDASRRTTVENAYVAGLGDSKRVVLYDNLLERAAPEELDFVVAHELGHEQQGHVLKGVALASIGLLVGFAALAWLASRPGVWAWANASGIADPRGLPLILLFATIATLIATPIENAVSRRFEAHADRISISLTNDSQGAVAAFRRLAFANLADLDPPGWVVSLLYTHPPIPDRIHAALEESPERP